MTTQQRDDDGLNDAWLQTEMHDLFLTRETGSALSQAALDGAIQTLKAGEPLSLPQAFDLLHQAQLGDMRIFGQMPVRATASPFIPSLGSAYIVSRRLCRDEQSSGVEIQHQQEAISVTFQSVLNSERWWSKDVLGFGVAARPMGRNVRTWKKNKESSGRAATSPEERETHGYRGRLYTLVARKAEVSPKAADKPGSTPPAFDDSSSVSKEDAGGTSPSAFDPPPSPTRSGSPPPRGSKRPRSSSAGGSMTAAADRCIAVGDIGIVQVWRPKSTSAYEPGPSTRILPINFSSSEGPTSPAPGSSSEFGGITSPSQSNFGQRFVPLPTEPFASGGGGTSSGGGPLMVNLHAAAAAMYRHQQQQQQQRAASPTRFRSAALTSDSPSSPEENPAFAGVGSPTRNNDVVLNGSLRVRGDIFAEGRVFGTFVTPPQAADYAEFFNFDPACLEQQPCTCGHKNCCLSAEPHKSDHCSAGKVAHANDEDHDGEVVVEVVHRRVQPPPGSVVQLRYEKQTITLDTTGNGPCLVLSTTPSVAAGVPCDPAETDKGALVAFLGQVPVRCRGRIACGDCLVPSNRCDGCAIAGQGDEPPSRIVGIAMSESDARDDVEETVLCMVKIEHAINRKVGETLHSLNKTQTHRAAVLGRYAALAWLVGKFAWLLETIYIELFSQQRSVFCTVASNTTELGLLCIDYGVTALVAALVFVFRVPSHYFHSPAVCWFVAFVLYFANQMALLADGGLDRQTRTWFDTAWTVLGIVYYFLLCRSFARVEAMVPSECPTQPSKLFSKSVEDANVKTSCKR